MADRVTVEQFALLPEPTAVKTTDRQQAVVDAVVRAGHDGIDTDRAGAILHARTGKHGVDDRCRWCGRDGKSVLRGELEPKGLVRYRRASSRAPGAWVVVASSDGPKDEPAACEACGAASESPHTRGCPNDDIPF